MMFREGLYSKSKVCGGEDKNTRLLNIFWKEIELLDGSVLYFNEFTGEISNIFLQSDEYKCKGGILADEMGLGILSLV